MTEYKGITKAKYPKWDGWYWLETYCTNKDERILENDPVLQTMVRRHYKKQYLKAILLTLSIWVGVALSIYYTKGN